MSFNWQREFSERTNRIIALSLAVGLTLALLIAYATTAIAAYQLIMS